MADHIPEGLYRGGPFVVFGRGHCGGRILSEVYHRNGLYMGRLSQKKFDTQGMGFKAPWMIDVAKGAYGYGQAPRAERERLERVVSEQVEALRREAAGEPFGWKIGSSIFAIEILLNACPFT